MERHHGWRLVAERQATIYEELLGVNRARYVALTQPQLTAREAERLGLVNEVVAKNAV